jgi:hypothetical protein
VEGAEYIQLNCSETKKWKEESACRKWLKINEGIAYRNITKCTNMMMLKNSGK